MDDRAPKAPLVNLGDASLNALPRAVMRPRYDRAGLRAGIVHIGLGNFHRAHQAWYAKISDGMGATAWCGLGFGPAGSRGEFG